MKVRHGYTPKAGILRWKVMVNQWNRARRLRHWWSRGLLPHISFLMPGTQLLDKHWNCWGKRAGSTPEMGWHTLLEARCMRSVLVRVYSAGCRINEWRPWGNPQILLNMFIFGSPNPCALWLSWLWKSHEVFNGHLEIGCWNLQPTVQGAPQLQVDLSWFITPLTVNEL